MGELYLWLKVIHILGVVSWMAGLFYLPRLFVYHAERGGNAALAETLCVMEQRLLAAIMRPAMAITLIAGIWLPKEMGLFGPVPVWLWLKGALVLVLLGYHGVLEWHAKRLRFGVESGSGRYFRVLNEVPTVLLIGIVILVVVKPF